MKIDDRYEIHVAVCNHDGVMLCDCYDDFRKLKEEHPHHSWEFVYLLIDSETGLIPDGFEDWYKSPDEVWFAYEEAFSGRIELLYERKDNEEGRFLKIGESLLCGEGSRFKTLTSGAQMIYLCMAMEAGEQQEVTFSCSTAQKYGIGKNVLPRAIKELIQAGFIEIADNLSYKQFKPTVYRFIIDWKSRL